MYDLFLTNADSLLLLVYKTAFANRRTFIENEFPLNNLSILIQRNVIDNTCQMKLVGNLTNLKPKIFMDYILEQTGIDIFESFLELCYEIRPELAKKIQKAIDAEKQSVGFIG